jgi:hypothetical protein
MPRIDIKTKADPDRIFNMYETHNDTFSLAIFCAFRLFFIKAKYLVVIFVSVFYPEKHFLYIGLIDEIDTHRLLYKMHNIFTLHKDSTYLSLCA